MSGRKRKGQGIYEISATSKKAKDFLQSEIKRIDDERKSKIEEWTRQSFGSVTHELETGIDIIEKYIQNNSLLGTETIMWLKNRALKLLATINNVRDGWISLVPAYVDNNDTITYRTAIQDTCRQWDTEVRQFGNDLRAFWHEGGKAIGRGLSIGKGFMAPGNRSIGYNVKRQGLRYSGQSKCTII